MKKRPSRTNPIFFTKDGGLDLSWVLLVVGCALMAGAIVCEGFHVLGFALPSYGWTALGAFVSFCFIAGAARDRAQILADATSPGKVAAAIAAACRPFGGKADQDDVDAVAPE